MPYKGTIKSLGKDYGFVDCPEIKALYGRDTFINKTLTGIQEYATLNVGEVITFDCSENPRGEPVAININGNPPAKGPLSKGGGKGKYKTFGPGEPGDYGEEGKGYDAGVYDAGQGGAMQTAPLIMYDPYEGKGAPAPAPAPDTFPAWAMGLDANGRPKFLPEDAQKVTLYGSAGWFVSQTSCEQLMANVSGGKGGGYPPAPQQVKRAAPDSWKGDGSWGKGDASYGKDGGYGKGDGGYGKSDGGYGKGGKGDAGKAGKPMKVAKLPDEPVANPGLEEGAQIYTGTVKSLSPQEGYGYVSDLTITQIYGKDAKLLLANCPWLKDMNLLVGESVAFNLDDASQGEPQITRIVRLAI